MSSISSIPCTVKVVVFVMYIKSSTTITLENQSVIDTLEGDVSISTNGTVTNARSFKARLSTVHKVM